MPRKRTGIVKMGHGSRSYPITDIEKTIVDCFDLIQYSGGFAELLRAVNQTSLNAGKLTEYCKAVNNIAVIKRIACLVEILGKKGMGPFIEYAKKQVNPKYNLFDPQGSDKGEFVSEWKLRMNISEKGIMNMVNKQY